MTPTLDEVVQFLCGEKPLENVWIGEPHPERKGNFWWRDILRKSAHEAIRLARERERDYYTVLPDRKTRMEALEAMSFADLEAILSLAISNQNYAQNRLFQERTFGKLHARTDATGDVMYKLWLYWWAYVRDVDFVCQEKLKRL